MAFSIDAIGAGKSKKATKGRYLEEFEQKAAKASNYASAMIGSLPGLLNGSISATNGVHNASSRL